ncbi:hypothetical protein D9611_013727 [Ephemerocybe angulata]|uniref:CHAT domain-containing protein n=1 Tax=Ephemerocybe angulata TaxID=980116 RepID=A0A8H5BCB4_9AGAR|nr:hypothetical protein D9611_013727 [Tulosesus angulatus]
MACLFNSTNTPEVERQYLTFLGAGADGERSTAAGDQVQWKAEKNAGNDVSAPKSNTNLATRLSNLGGWFQSRVQNTEEKHDLAEDSSPREREVELAPDGRALDLAGTLFSTPESQYHKAIELTPEGDPRLLDYLTNLGISFASRFEQTGELSDITEAILVHQKAVKLTPPGHVDAPTRLNNLAMSLSCRFEQTNELSDICEAISALQKAMELSSHEHVDMSSRHNNLGQLFYYRFILAGDEGDLEQTVSNYASAANCPAGSPRVKLDGARRWADTLLQHHQSPDIIIAFDKALSLVALIIGLEQTVQSRYTQLEEIPGLTLEAAAAACAFNRTDKALEWLEQGRCLVWTQLNNLRTPLDLLYTHDAALAKRITDTAKQLETAGSSRGQLHASMSLGEKISLEDKSRAHLDIAQQWDGLLKLARAIPGFESFLMPSPCSALMHHLPESGPIIVINMNENRCDALALLAGLEEPLHIPLPNFSIRTASTFCAILDSQLRSHNLRVRDMGAITPNDGERGIRPVPIGKRGDDHPVHLVLRGMWEDLVKPILDALGFSPVAPCSGVLPPRLWWCPTGPLSFLPLHAAGIYRGLKRESISDYVVSSYTPTVTAISNQVKNARSVDAKASGLLLTSQPSVAGASPIPGTTSEVRSIFKRAEENGVRALKYEGDELTVDVCLERMHDFSSIHLACHGSQNATEPLRSRFLFHRGSLELGRIIQSNIENGDLAFLSACETSTGQEKLSDEAVHLAAGMLAAGYRRVVGTMWSIGDDAAQSVAIMFYNYLFAQSDTGFDGAMSAYALHHATQQLRLTLDDSENSLLTWMPFVHFGY